VLFLPRPPVRPLVPLLPRPARLPELLLVEPPPLLRLPDAARELRVAEEPVRPPPRLASPPFLATAVFIRVLADARPLLEVPFDALREDDLDAVFEPPREDDFDAPPLADLEAALREDDLDAAPREDDLDAPPLADLDAPPLDDFDAAAREDDLDAAPLDVDLDAAFERPRDADFDAPPLDDFDADLEPPREDFDALLLEAVRPEDLLADLLLPFDAPFEDFEEPPRPEDDPPPVRELPPREDFDAAFFAAPFDEELRPELLLADFLEAAFLVDFAMLMVFRVSVNL
jgi:hypothetical protein